MGDGHRRAKRPISFRTLALGVVGLLTLIASSGSTTSDPVASRQLVLDVSFDAGLGPFAYDDTWGCGFGDQSDFMGDLRQVAVSGGVATIAAERAETPCGREFASAVMSTRNTFSQAYGYFEARMRFDAGNGLWPAFWMQPADGSWPPEIDVLEAYPNEDGSWPGATRYMAALHFGEDNQTVDIVADPGAYLPGGWHTYGVEWTTGALTFYFDGREMGRITEEVPSTPMYLILNLAVGNWTAPAEATTPDRAVMEIDFVRVWR
jgi:beta-glucanase (GH16 family)